MKHFGKALSYLLHRVGWFYKYRQKQHVTSWDNQENQLPEYCSSYWQIKN